MNKVKIILIIVVMSYLVGAVDDLMSLQGKVDQSGVLVDSGDIVVEIWDSSSGGTLVYNSTGDFNNAIIGGFFDIVLGSGSNSLTLNLSQIYYMDIAIEGQDIDWGGDERRQFQTTAGAPKFPEETILNNTLYTKDARVGIGDSSPGHTLSISGNLSLDSGEFASCTSLETDSAGGVRCGSDSGEGGDSFPGWDSNLVWHNQSLNSTIALWIDNNTDTGVSNWDSNIAWLNETQSFTKNNTFDEDVFISTRLGVGTINPQAKLDIDDSSWWDSARIPAVGIKSIRPALAIYDDNSDGNNVTVLYQNQQDFIIASTAFTTDDWGYDERTDIFIVDGATNNVGIRTSNPLTTLHVNGIGLFSQATDAKIQINTTTRGTKWEWQAIDSDGRFRLNALSAAEGTKADVITFLEDGNVGIGTTNPNKTLTILGNLSLAGPEYISCTSLETDAEGGVRCGSDDSGTAATTFWAGSSVNEIYNDTTSGVGIGTNNPSYLLEVNSVDSALNVSGMLYVNSSSVGIGTSNPGSSFIVNSGDVGIGTTSPGSDTPNGWESGGTLLEIRDTTADTGLLLRESDTGGLNIWWDESLNDAYFDNIGDASTADIFFRTRTKGTPINALTIEGGGDVGIGTTDPLALLEVEGGTLQVTPNALAEEESKTNFVTPISVTVDHANWSNRELRLQSSRTTGAYSQYILFNAHLDGHNNFYRGNYGTMMGIEFDDVSDSIRFLVNNSAGSGSNSRVVPYKAMTIDSSGNVGIGDSTPTYKLDVAGTGRFTGDLFVTGNITGSGADIAEYIEFSNKKPEPGDVVVIDYNNKIKKSNKAYDTKVAGIVSTKPGMILSSETGGVLLAMAGRVPIKVTNENGNIMPGDLLTTSNKPGYAMKCNYIYLCRGALVAKALEPFNKEEGKINALVMLG